MNICIFGASITWGAYDPEEGGWANRLRNYFEANFDDVDVFNLGIPGDTTDKLLKRIEVEATAREPNIIIISIGLNDTQYIHSLNGHRVSVEEFKANIEKIIWVAKKFTDKIIFIELTPVDESRTNPITWNEDKSYLNKKVEEFNHEVEIIFQEKGLKFISIKGLIENKDLFDGLHPTTQGHIKLFEKIKPEIEKIVKEFK